MLYLDAPSPVEEALLHSTLPTPKAFVNTREECLRLKTLDDWPRVANLNRLEHAFFVIRNTGLRAPTSSKSPESFDTPIFLFKLAGAIDRERMSNEPW